MLRKQKAASNVQARLLCAEVYRDANPVCRCFRRPAEYTADGKTVQLRWSACAADELSMALLVIHWLAGRAKSKKPGSGARSQWMRPLLD